MPLGLSEETKDLLKYRLSARLGDLSVINGNFLSGAQNLNLRTLDAALPQKGEVRRLLNEFIGQNPASTFAYWILHEMVHSNFDFASGAGSVPLIRLTGFENPLAVANDIIDKFESLPWSYIITIPLDCALGKKLASIGKELQISDDISIVTPGEKVWEQFPLTTGNPRKDSTLIPLGLGLIVRRQSIWHRLSYILRDTFLPVLSPV